MYQSVTIEQQHAGDLQDELAFEKKTLDALSKDTIIYTIQGPFFFGIAEKVEHALIVTHNTPKNIIFRFKYMTFIDMTGLHQLRSIIKRYKKYDVKVYICEANTIVNTKLSKNSILDLVVAQKVFATLTDVIQLIKENNAVVET
jgi:SulP family sulfate permease